MNATRLDIRLKPVTKEMIQHAAELRNQSVTQFIITTLAEEAGKVVAEHERRVLSNRDRDHFMKLLDAPPRPNKTLRKAVEKYRKQHAS